MSDEKFQHRQSIRRTLVKCGAPKSGAKTPYRRRARPTGALLADDEAISQHLQTLAPSASKVQAGRIVRAAKDQDEFVYLSSEEEDAGDDDEVCSYGDSHGALKSSLPGYFGGSLGDLYAASPCSKTKKDASLELVTTQETKVQQHTRESSVEEPASSAHQDLALDPKALERVHSSDSEDVMFSPLPTTKCSLSEVEFTSRGYTRVIGDLAQAAALFASTHAQLDELTAKLQHPSPLAARRSNDTSDNKFSPNSPHSSADDKPHASVNAQQETQYSHESPKCDHNDSGSFKKSVPVSAAVTVAGHASTVSVVLSPLSLQRLHAQCQAVEYRRAMRKQLQSTAVAARLAGASSSVGTIGGALEMGRVMWDLCATPWAVLDGEVLSADEEEEETCRERRGKWTVTQTHTLE